MADSTTNIDNVVTSSYGKEAQVNAVLDAASPATTYGRRASTTSGLTWGYYGGKASLAGVITAIANGTVVLSASTTNYVEAHPDTGAVSKNTTGFTAGYLPLYTIVTGSASVTSYTDKRAQALATNATLAKALTDANATLTQAEAANAVLTFTGTLTNTRDIVVPLVGKRQWTVYNGTGQSLQFIGATGTGITVATLKHAIVRSDGTNIVRVSDDSPPTFTATKTAAYTVVDSDLYLIFNGSASITVTLPTASSWPGREINLKTIAAFTVISASSNVVPLDTATAGTAILAATAGKWARLVSDGTNWIVMAGN